MIRKIAPATLKELHTLFGELVDLHNTGEYTAFYDFSGHVCTLTVQIYRGRWGLRKKPLIYNYISLDRPLYKWEISEGKKDIPQLLEYIKTLKEKIR